MSQSYNVEITQAAAHRLAREVAQSSSSPTFLCNIMVEAMDGLFAIEGGEAKLQRALARHGYKLVSTDEPEAPANGTIHTASKPKRCKPAQDDEEATTRRKRKPKVYPTVAVSGPRLAGLISTFAVSDDTLMREFEVDQKELDTIHSQTWTYFPARNLHELCTDLESESLQPRRRPSNLNSVENYDGWLAIKRLIAHFKLGPAQLEEAGLLYTEAVRLGLEHRGPLTNLELFDIHEKLKAYLLEKQSWL